MKSSKQNVHQIFSKLNVSSVAIVEDTAMRIMCNIHHNQCV